MTQPQPQPQAPSQPQPKYDDASHLQPDATLYGKLTSQPHDTRRQAPLLFIDGPQGAGKSTLIRNITKHNPDFVATRYNHRETTLRQLIDTKDIPQVVDRGPLSPFIYNMLWNTEGQMDWAPGDAVCAPGYQPVAFTDIAVSVRMSSLYVVLASSSDKWLRDGLAGREAWSGRGVSPAERLLLAQSNSLFVHLGRWLVQSWSRRVLLLDVSGLSPREVYGCVVRAAGGVGVVLGPLC